MFKNMTAQVGNTNVDLLWPKGDESCFTLINNDWFDFIPHIMKWVKNPGVVVQAGGNCGLYPLRYAQIFERVFTFEPEPKNFHCLVNNCKSNRIVKFGAALGDAGGFAMLSIADIENNGMHKIGDSGKETIFVYQVTIDSLNLPSCDLIHLDIEEYEYFALLGAKQTITKHKPAVVVEITDSVKQIQDLMKSLDYIEVAKFGSGVNNCIFMPKL